MAKKMFDFCIGNPPYQANIENAGDRANPVYDKFMDAAFDVASCVELIHPARFLFNAGQTPKVWNSKMLSDEHFKVLSYEPDASKIFTNTEIKGGVAITLRDSEKDFGAIGTFTPYEQLNHIIKRVSLKAEEPFSTIVSNRGMYRFTEEFYHDYPEVKGKVGKGSGNMIVSNIFEKAPEVFSEKPGTDTISVLGRKSGKRIYRFLKRAYVIDVPYIDKYKLFFPEANGNGQYGEALTLPDIGAKGMCSTDTFINIGLFNTELEAGALLKYIKSKFLRALLGAKKATQHSPKSVWELIPLQNFTPSSDIDWSKSVHEIDLQLYRKYGLSSEEIDFIETNVKEMI